MGNLSINRFWVQVRGLFKRLWVLFDLRKCARGPSCRYPLISCLSRHAADWLILADTTHDLNPSWGVHARKCEHPIGPGNSSLPIMQITCIFRGTRLECRPWPVHPASVLRLKPSWFQGNPMPGPLRS